MVFVREETSCFPCSRNRNLTEGFRSVSPSVFICQRAQTFQILKQLTDFRQPGYGNFVQFPKSINQHGDEVTQEVDASLTLDPEVMYENKVIGKMCTFLKISLSNKCQISVQIWYEESKQSLSHCELSSGLRFNKFQRMSELDKPLLHYPEPKGNQPHSFTGGYVSVLLKRLHKRRRYRF